ncbi:unnamed protein product [Victoria cruziana]
MGSTHLGFSFYSFEVSEDSQSQTPLENWSASEASPITFDDDAESCSGDHEQPSPCPETDDKHDYLADDRQIRGFRSGVGRERAAGGKAAKLQPQAQETVMAVDHGAFPRDSYAGAAAEEQIADDEDDPPGSCHYTADQLIQREMEMSRLFWEACLGKW